MIKSSLYIKQILQFALSLAVLIITLPAFAGAISVSQSLDRSDIAFTDTTVFEIILQTALLCSH